MFIPGYEWTDLVSLGCLTTLSRPWLYGAQRGAETAWQVYTRKHSVQLEESNPSEETTEEKLQKWGGGRWRVGLGVCLQVSVVVPAPCKVVPAPFAHNRGTRRSRRIFKNIDHPERVSFTAKNQILLWCKKNPWWTVINKLTCPWGAICLLPR